MEKGPYLLQCSNNKVLVPSGKKINVVTHFLIYLTRFELRLQHLTILVVIEAKPFLGKYFSVFVGSNTCSKYELHKSIVMHLFDEHNRPLGLCTFKNNKRVSCKAS